LASPAPRRRPGRRGRGGGLIPALRSRGWRPWRRRPEVDGGGALGILTEKNQKEKRGKGGGGGLRRERG
jgi:hypothetical protein